MIKSIIFAATAAITIASAATAQNATEWLNANAYTNDGTNCALGSPEYNSCIQNRENTLNRIGKVNTNANMEPASGSHVRANADGTTTINGNSSLQIKQGGGFSTPGTTANPAQR